MHYLNPMSLQAWIEEHRHLLKPPVGNLVIYKEHADFIVMAVGGPNKRSDYHVNETEEFFYQVEGDINLRIMDNGQRKDIHIREGEIFLLPRGVPHSPQRPAGSIGVVIERKRLPEMQDGFLWFCENCDTKLYEEYFHVNDIITQLPQVFDRYFSSPQYVSCPRCGFSHKNGARNQDS